MDSRFLPHNTHLESPKAFPALDPHLRLLAKQPLIHYSQFLERIPVDTPGIYTLTGGRQIGKTTFLKQWMAKLLAAGTEPKSLIYVTGELIDDHHSLTRLLMDLVNEMPSVGLKYIVLDEVTYIRDWDKGIKYLADSGMLEEAVLLITGSDLVIIKEARMWFPGRRGASLTVDFHMHPLSFFEVARLKNMINADEIVQCVSKHNNIPRECSDRIFREFKSYLAHGGFLTAINDMTAYGRIKSSTFSTYSDCIRGDVLKRNKQEHYLFEILEAIVKRYGSLITWNSLSKDLSIDHPKTISDYVALLASMDAVFIQPALKEDKLTGAPKKARKVMFRDPFIFHAVNAWLKPCPDPFVQQVKPMLGDQDRSAKLIESCAATHFSRYYPTYYIKAEGEVDIAYVESNKFWPIEVKWTGQLRPKDLKQISKYKNGLILTKSKTQGVIQGIRTVPLPLALLSISPALRKHLYAQI